MYTVRSTYSLPKYLRNIHMSLFNILVLFNYTYLKKKIIYSYLNYINIVSILT